MELYSLTAPCHFGLEAVLKKEIYDMGYDITRVDDGRVTFEGDAEAIARANIFSRSAERILIECASFKAESFEELYDKSRALDWSRFIPQNGKFWITKASSVKSKLHSPSDIQSIMKKAMVDSLKKSYHTGSLLEDGAEYPFRVFIKKDMVTIGLDTTGESLHKRGYRKLTAKAPIAENLAAARSQIEDADIAQQITTLKNNNVRTAMQNVLMDQSNQNANNILRWIQG